MERILGIDFGGKRIGLAVSDGLGLTAQSLFTIKRSSLKKDMLVLKEIVKENKVGKLVVGLPLDKNGGIDRNSPVLDFIARLKDNLKLTVDTWDERLSSVEAGSVLLGADISRRKRKAVIDKLAAQIILQGYLDYVNNKKEKPG